MTGVIQRKRTKGWRKPEGAVYVGRGSRFGNPFRSGDREADTNSFAQLLEGDTWIENGRYMAVREMILGSLWQLTGKTLMCWCGSWMPGEPEIPCHAVVLAKAAYAT